eukprot:5264013-Alexandrium_andersonii.AAC.1
MLNPFALLIDASISKGVGMRVAKPEHGIHADANHVLVGDMRLHLDEGSRLEASGMQNRLEEGPQVPIGLVGPVGR